MRSLFARLAATISELKANPNEVLNQANGEPIVILSHNKPRAYMVPVETFEQMQEQLEDYRLLQEARKRMDDESVPVTIDELRAGIQEKALKEWNKLNPTVQAEFLNILERRLENPRIPKHQLKGSSDFYKIKLRSQGFRLVYHVDDGKVIVTVVTVGRRDMVYKGF